MDGGRSVATRRGYISDYKRAAADIYRVNTTTGERDADAQESVDQHLDRQPHLRHFARRALLPLLEGQQVPGLRSRRGEHPHAWRRDHRPASWTRSSIIPDPSPPTASPATPPTRSRSSCSSGSISGSCRSTARRVATSPTERARRARSVSATFAPSPIRPVRPVAVAAAVDSADAAAAARRAPRSISPSRSRSRPTASTPRRPASTSSPTAS